MSTGIDRVFEQLELFIKKYYKNELIKGAIIALAMLISFFVVVAVLEYLAWFPSWLRMALFYFYVFLGVSTVLYFFVRPLAQLFAIGKRMTPEHAARLVGAFFPEVDDKIVNTLNLSTKLSPSVDSDLLLAALEQRSERLNRFNFTQAIDFKKNTFYVRYALPGFVLFLIILAVRPSIFSEATHRLVHYDKYFSPPAPFTFHVDKKLLTLEEGADFELDVLIKGTKLPEDVVLVQGALTSKMLRRSKVSFSYVIPKVMSSFDFRLRGNGFESDLFRVNVIPKSKFAKLDARISYPKYLGLKPAYIKNVSSMEVPEGALIEYVVETKATRKLAVNWEGKSVIYSNSSFSHKVVARSSGVLEWKKWNVNNDICDFTKHDLVVVKDAFPTILVSEEIDSLAEGIRYFSGMLSDDHGLTSLTFHYTIESGSSKRSNKLNVGKVNGTEMPFTFGIDFRREQLKPNDKIVYYFSVSDNDGVNGAKTTRSEQWTYELPSLSELNDRREEKQEAIKSSMSDMMKKVVDFQKNVDRLKRDVMNSKSSDWNKMNQVQQLKDQQQQLQQELQQVKDKMNESLDEKNMLSEMDKELLEKYEEIQKLLEKLMDDELKDLLKQLEEMMKKANNPQLQDKLEKVEIKSEDMKKQLDRSMEMLKKMQANEKLNDIQKELRELSKEQKELKKELDTKGNSKDIQEKQDQINKRFEDIKEDLKEFKELNESLQRPMSIDEHKQDQEGIEKDIKDAKESLEKNKSSKAGEKQQSGSDKMQELADKLQKEQDQANKKENEEDMEAIRQLLKSLMNLSFRQEDNMNRLAKVKEHGPYYRKLGKRQRIIVDDTKDVEDSLNALAKRNPKIASFIDQELNTIRSSFALAMEDIDEHRARQAATKLQYVMTSYNNLALLLNESLQQMQQQLAAQMQGSGSCDNPGGKGKKPKPGSGDMDMKETLKKQLEQMKKGPNPGGQQPGDKQGQGMMGLGNEQIAKMAAEQTAIRQRLEQLRNELNKEGKGMGNQLNPLINQLEQQEKDLINKKFSQEMINRQKDILTRLLESEKALMERGFDDKRESKEGKNLNYSNQKRLDEYNNQKIRQIELLRSLDPTFNKYYKDKASEYFNRF